MTLPSLLRLANLAAYSNHLSNSQTPAAQASPQTSEIASVGWRAGAVHFRKPRGDPSLRASLGASAPGVCAQAVVLGEACGRAWERRGAPRAPQLMAGFSQRALTGQPGAVSDHSSVLGLQTAEKLAGPGDFPTSTVSPCCLLWARQEGSLNEPACRALMEIPLSLSRVWSPEAWSPFSCVSDFPEAVGWSSVAITAAPS